jgi:hypothetical protein
MSILTKLKFIKLLSTPGLDNSSIEKKRDMSTKQTTIASEE